MQSSTNSYEKLISILEKEFDLLSGLVELLQKEKDVIAGTDLTALDNYIREKELLIAKIRVCEEARERELKYLGLSNKKLSVIAAESGPEHKDRLALIASKFKSITHSIAELNKLNGLLIDKSLFYIKSSRRFLETFGVKPVGKVSVEV
jgi:flagellar biosynthesis/type III secretory pathway chaperone